MTLWATCGRWTVDGSGKTQAYYQDTTGFGLVTSTGGASPSPFKFGGGNGCQTETDIGLVLMGHRYYDPRTGRFISQNPAGDGDNWYAYAGNSPTNAIDPSGLDEIDCDRVPSDWQQQALAMDGDYNGEAITTDDNGIIHWSDGTNDHSYCLNDMSGGADWSASPWISMGAGGSGAGGGTQAAAISSFSSSFSNFFMQGSMGTNMGNPGGMAIMNHTKGARPSTEGPHQLGLARLKRDKGGEKGDKRRLQAIRDKADKKGPSTRDPDGSLKRAREAADAEKRAARQGSSGSEPEEEYPPSNVPIYPGGDTWEQEEAH